MQIHMYDVLPDILTGYLSELWNATREHGYGLFPFNAFSTLNLLHFTPVFPLTLDIT